MYKVKLEKFEGPLNLLLELIEKDDMDISQISLANVADDFINYVNENKGIPLEELADFLLVASKLIYIKSKSLLPYLVWGEEEEDAAGLEAQLKLYKEFLSASNKLEALIKEKNFLFARERVVVPRGFYPPLLRSSFARGYGIAQQGFQLHPTGFAGRVAGQAEKISANILKSVYLEILKRIEPFIKTGEEIKNRVVSIKQKIEDLKSIIGRRAKIGFKEFIGKAKNKTEVIISFLALLELMKQKIINVEQGGLFEEITINKK